MSPERLLITGGSGFIGTHLVEASVASGYEVLNADVKPPVLAAQRPWWRHVNVLDLGTFKRLVADSRPDAIVNLAGLADLALSYEDMRVNFVSIENVLEAARVLDSPPRIVHASTQLVVESGHKLSSPRDYAPYSEYGRSKATSEEVLWAKGESLEWTIVRPTNVWGPFHPIYAQSTWKYISRRWYMIPTGATPVRSFGYVGNVAAQLIKAVKAAPALVDRKVFYVGDEPMALALWLDGLLARSHRQACATRARRPAKCRRLRRRSHETRGRPSAPRPRSTLQDHHRLCGAHDAHDGTLGSGPVLLGEGITETVAWLQRAFPHEFARR